MFCASDFWIPISTGGVRGTRGNCPPSRQSSQPGLAPYPAAGAHGLTTGGGEDCGEVQKKAQGERKCCPHTSKTHAPRTPRVRFSLSPAVPTSGAKGAGGISGWSYGAALCAKETEMTAVQNTSVRCPRACGLCPYQRSCPFPWFCPVPCPALQCCPPPPLCTSPPSSILICNFLLNCVKRHTTRQRHITYPLPHSNLLQPQGTPNMHPHGLRCASWPKDLQRLREPS